MKTDELKKLASALELVGYEIVELELHREGAVEGAYPDQATGDLQIRITPVKE